MTSGLTICELYLRNLSSGALLTGTWTANTSGNGATSNLTDGNGGTFWGASATGTIGAPNWLVIDLGPAGADVVDQIEMTARSGFQSQTPDNFILQYSDDNTNWFNATNYANVDSWLSAQRKIFRVRPYIVRFLFDSPFSGSMTTVTELEIKNSALGDLTSPVTTSDAVGGSIFGTHDGSPPANAFNNVIDNSYTGNAGNPSFTEWRFPTQPSIDSVTVSVRTGFPSQGPKSFKLRISRDGFTYTTVMQPADVTSWAAGETKTFVRTPPVFTTLPSISGDDTAYGHLLTCSPGVQTMGPNITLTYQWYRSGVALPGETSNTYTTVAGDDMKVMTCTVKATNELGFTTASGSIFIGGQYARYWRMRTWDGSYLANMACAELELNPSPGGADQTSLNTFLGSELISGTPTTYTGVTYSGGVATCSAAAQIVTFNPPLVVGLRYRARFNYTITSGSGLRITNFNTNGTNTVYTSAALTGSGSIDVVFVATNTYFSIEASGATYSGTISSISCMQTTAITASATLSGYPASQAIDDNSGTMWNSGRAVPAGGENLTLDFLAVNAAKVQELTYQTRSDNFAEDPKGLYLEYSPDNVTWTTYWNSGPLGAWARGEKRVFPTGAPIGIAVITGSPSVGATLTANTSGVYNATSFTYQWKADGVPIIGATSSTYTTVEGDFNRTITCVVVATNLWGTQTFTTAGMFIAANVAIRTAGFVNVASSSTKVIDLVAIGAQAGDRVVFIGGHGFAYSSISTTGWTVTNNDAGSNYNGFIIQKVLTAGDITTATVTITFTGTYDGCIAYIVTNGTTNAVRYIQGARDASGAGVINKTSDGTPQSGDLAYLFAGARGVRTPSLAPGAITTVGSGTQGDGAGALFSFPISANGAVTKTVSYSATGTDYIGWVIFSGSALTGGSLDTIATDAANITIDSSTVEM
jgi:hypothetical protein